MNKSDTLSKLVLFILSELNQEIVGKFLSIHIGSEYVTKEEIIHKVSTSSQEMINFINYASWCADFLTNGKTLNDFIDAQLDDLNKPGMKDRHALINKYMSVFLSALNY